MTFWQVALLFLACWFCLSFSLLALRVLAVELRRSGRSRRHGGYIRPRASRTQRATTPTRLVTRINAATTSSVTERGAGLMDPAIRQRLAMPNSVTARGSSTAGTDAGVSGQLATSADFEPNRWYEMGDDGLWRKP